jgi:hypothetical protein
MRLPGARATASNAAQAGPSRCAPMPPTVDCAALGTDGGASVGRRCPWSTGPVRTGSLHEDAMMRGQSSLWWNPVEVAFCGVRWRFRDAADPLSPLAGLEAPSAPARRERGEHGQTNGSEVIQMTDDSPDDDSPDDDSPDDSRARRPEHRPSGMSARRANGPRSARGHSQTHHVDNGDSERLRFCNGPNAEDAAMMLHRGLGLPEPQGVSALWSARKVRCVEYRTGERPAVDR